MTNPLKLKTTSIPSPTKKPNKVVREEEEYDEVEYGEEEEDEEEVALTDAPAASKPAKKDTPPFPRAPISQVRKQITEERDLNLIDFLHQLGTAQDTMRIYVTRKMPKMWDGHNIAGSLDMFEEPISEEDLKENYGGGVYSVSVQIPNSRGKFQIAAQKTIRIAGDPKTEGLIAEKAPVEKTEDVGVVKVAMDTMKNMIDRPKDDLMVKALVDNMQMQMRELQRSVAEKDERLLGLLTQKPEVGTADRLLEKMMGAESARIEALRLQHDSELRTTRERAQGDADRLTSAYVEQLRVQERAHDREIDSLKASHEAQLRSLELAHGTSSQGLQRENRHLDMLLTEAKTELAALRAQKTKTPIEMLTEITHLKDAFSSLGGEEKEESSTVERIINGVMSSPLAQGIAQRVAEGPGGPAAASASSAKEQFEKDFPVNQPRKLPDGRIVVRKPDGQVVEFKPKPKKSVAVKGGSKITLDPTDLKSAVRFLEGAVGKTEPAIMAQTVRNVIPPSIQQAFARNAEGVDHFLDEVATLEPGSQLSTQAGRTWLREVAKHLMG